VLKLALWVQTIPLNPCNMLLIMKVNNVVVHVTFTYSAVTFFFNVWRRCSIRLYLRLFVGGLMSCLSYFCVLAHSAVQHILRVFCCFVVVFLSSSYVAIFSGLFILFCLFDVLNYAANNCVFLPFY
jgi:hypothetical protein